MARAVHTLAAALLLVACNAEINLADMAERPYMPIEFDASEFAENGEVVLLETTTGRQCSSVGDTHVNAFDLYGRGMFHVMGTKEWIMAEGPKDVAGTKHWVLQATQATWQNCGRSNPQITVLKDFAFRCGDFFMLSDSPPYSWGCSGVGDTYPHFYLRGVDKSGKIYDGSDYYPTLKKNQVIYFDGGYLQIYAVGCPGGVCKQGRDYHNGDSMMFRYRFGCDQSYTDVYTYGYSNGASFSQMYSNLGESARSAGARCGSSSNLVAGVCGCYDQKVASTIQNQHRTCHHSNFYSSGSLSCWAPYFITTPENSIFSMFERWTKDLAASKRYDGMHALISESQLAKQLPFDKVKWELCAEKCKTLLTNLLGFVPDLTKTKEDPRAMLADSMLSACTIDVYAELEWGDAEFQALYCKAAAMAIDDEREDVFCAYSKLSTECDSVEPTGDYLAMLSNAKSESQVEQIKKENSDIFAMIDEVDSSLDNIDFWFVDACATKTPKTENLDKTDCTNHVFVNTQELVCPPTPPVANMAWQGDCPPKQTHGGKCTGVCATGAIAMPAGSANSAQYECNARIQEGTPVATWETAKTVQCCARGCDKRAEYSTNTCVAGKFTCEFCEAGKVGDTAGTGCVNAECPRNAHKKPKCECMPGFKGTLTWNFDTASWLGACVTADCPANAGTNTQDCKCQPGFAGELVWTSIDGWTGSCMACTAKVNYATTAGSKTCQACTTCDVDKTEVMVSECTSTKNRVCACNIGHSGTPGNCKICQQDSGKVVRYSDTTGLSECKGCMVCNTEREIEVQACTPTSNTICRCRPPYGTVANKEGCHELVVS